MFVCYPSYKQPARSKVCSDSRSDKCAPEFDNDNCKKKQKMAISSEVGDQTTADNAVEPDDTTTVVVEQTVEPPCNNTFPVDDRLSVASALLARSTISEEQLVFKSVARDEPLAFAK